MKTFESVQFLFDAMKGVVGDFIAGGHASLANIQMIFEGFAAVDVK